MLLCSSFLNRPLNSYSLFLVSWSSLLIAQVAFIDRTLPKPSHKNETHKIEKGVDHTILTEMMADEFNFVRPEIENYKAEADADLILIPGQLELHGRCRCGLLLSTCFCAPFVADPNCGDGGIRITLQTQRQIQFPKKLK